MSTTYTIVSWGITLALVLGAVYIYNPELIRKVLASRDSVQASHASSAQAPTTKPKKGNKVSAKPDLLRNASSIENLSEREARTSKKRKIATPASSTNTGTGGGDPIKESLKKADTAVSDSDFAQQLKKAQAGTKLQSKPQPKATISNQLSNEKRETHQQPLTTDEDAGDDQSSEQSAPPLQAASSNDISDMLEAPAAPRTTLRLTNISTESSKPTQAKKQFEQVQSKKKRNEQKRREEQRREIEESNQLWEKKKQEQMRTARLAAGTSNQIKANTFTNTVNAWQKKPQSPSDQEKNLSTGPLLDTFESASSKSTAPAVQTASMVEMTSKPLASNNVNALKETQGENKTSALAASAREQHPPTTWADQLSEEEQIQRLRDQDKEEAWEAVTSKKSKKTKKAENDTSSDTSSVPPSMQSNPPRTEINGSKTNGAAKPREAANRFQSIQAGDSNGLQDDDWGA